MISLLMVFASSSFAGKGLPPELQKKYIKECKEETSAHACVELANETLCGKGYNPTYAEYMKQACSVYRKNCEKGSQTACVHYSGCLLDCSPLSEEAYFSQTVSALGLKECFVEEKKDNQSKGLQLLEQACQKGEAAGCMGMALSLEATEDSSIGAKQDWLRRACALEYLDGCTKFHESLQSEMELVREKSCELGAKEFCQEKTE